MEPFRETVKEPCEDVMMMFYVLLDAEEGRRWKRLACEEEMDASSPMWSFNRLR